MANIWLSKEEADLAEKAGVFVHRTSLWDTGLGTYSVSTEGLLTRLAEVVEDIRELQNAVEEINNRLPEGTIDGPRF